MNARIYFLKAYTPMHQGIGQVPAPVDLPIAREKHTGYPIIRHMKGPIRAWYGRQERSSEDMENEIFGPPNISSEGGASAGRIIFSDAYLLFFPVRAAFVPFYMVTCPFALKRFVRHLEMLKEKPKILKDEHEKLESIVKRLEADKSDVALISESVGRRKDIIEGFSLQLAEDGDVESLKELFPDELFSGMPLMVVSDTLFSYIVQSFTEVVARVKLKADNGTVESGPWWEEYVPAEAVFYMWVQKRERKQERKQNSDHTKKKKEVEEKDKNKDKEREIEEAIKDLFRDLNNAFLEVGGDITVGKGKVKMIPWEEGDGGEK